LTIKAVGVATGSTSTRNMIIRHNTSSGAVTGGTEAVFTQFSSTQLSAEICRNIHADNATNVQTMVQFTNAGIGLSTSGLTSGSIDMTAASYINFNGYVANASDSIGYKTADIEWFEK